MRKTIWFLLALVILGAGGTGCDSDIDPDTLVRELRVLAMRVGDAIPGSAAEVQAMVDLSRGPNMPDLVFSQPSVRLSVLTGAPVGPGRRIGATASGGPRLRRYDWFACVGPLSLFSPGTLDSQCLKFKPGDPPPRQNPALFPLVPAGLAPADGTLDVPTDQLKAILGQFLTVALGGGGGGPGGMLMLPTQPLVLLLPILVEVVVPPPDGDPNNPLDREIGYTFLRIVIALPGMTLPPPNRNPSLPLLGGVWAGSVPAADNPTMTRVTPCLEGGSCAPYAIPREGPVYFVGRSDSGSAETYTPLDDSGRTDVVETLRYAWFTSDGSFGDERTGDTQPETEWRNEEKRPAPVESSYVDLWLVVQDDRAGCDYQHFQLKFP